MSFTKTFGWLSFALLVACGCDGNITALDEILLKSGPEGAATPTTIGLSYEEVTIETTGGKRLAGWFIPAIDGPARATVMIHTGMQGNMSDYLLLFPWFAERGLSTFIYDWQGFGASEGQRRFVNFEADTHAAVDYLVARPEPASRVIVHFGVSLGGAAALGAAARVPDQTIGAIAYGAFDPAALPADYMLTQVSPLFLPLGWVSGWVFGPLATPFLAPQTHLPGVRDPILALIAEDDRIVPPETQLRLFELYPDPKMIIYTLGDHITAHKTDPELGNKIVGWINTLAGLIAPS